ncbi:MAG TPA: MFS transporter [Croceibacterium sp.]|nr:MFS transporter [Croceibacterium sp.]
MTTRIADERGLDASGWLLVAGIVLASLTEALAGTVVALGRGDIMGDTHASLDQFASFDVSYTALKLVGFALSPWLLTRIEPRNALVASTLAMGVASALAMVTARLDALSGLRALQGLAGGIVLVTGQAILFLTFPRRRQPLLQALFAMGAVVAPATLAPAMQGWLIDNLSWTWIFYGILPLALAGAGLVMIADPPPMPPVVAWRLDWAGMALLGCAMSGATYVLTQGSRWDWFEAGRILWLSGLAGGCLVLFLLHQRRAARPALFDLSVFRNDDFTFAFLVSFVAGAALFGSAFLIPSFAVSVLGFTPAAAGGLLLPSGALFAGALLLSAFLVQTCRTPPLASVPFGILLIMAAMWMLSGSNGDSGAPDMMPAILLRGLGLGFLFLSLTLVAFDRLPPANLASGIGLFSIGRQLGGLIGVAGLQTLIDHQAVANQAVLGAALNPGSPLLADRIASLTAILVTRGMDAASAAKAATGMLGRATAGQASVIAFDTAFSVVALLFVFAAPALIGVKIGLARAARRRGAADAEVIS